MSEIDLQWCTERLLELETWVRSYPMTQEFRERTTYRQFHQLEAAKRLELGLTDAIWAAMVRLDEDPGMERAWQEFQMTLDHRELVCPTYYQDLPLNFWWMDEYDSVQQAVDDFIDHHPLGSPITDDDLIAVVQRNLPPVASKP